MNINYEPNPIITEKMGRDEVKALLEAFLESSAEEFLKEQWEDETDEWIET